MIRNVCLRNMLELGGIATMMLLIGCYSAKDLSTRYVPCSQEEIQIVDERGSIQGTNPDSWTVICHGKEYYCAARYSQGAPKVDCIESDE
jgi:hypothetical protein